MQQQREERPGRSVTTLTLTTGSHVRSSFCRQVLLGGVYIFMDKQYDGLWVACKERTVQSKSEVLRGYQLEVMYMISYRKAYGLIAPLT